MKAGTDRKAKFRQLQRDLKLPRYAVVGLLQSLWDFAAVNTPEGDVGRFSDEDIALDIEYEGSPDELIDTLVNRRWLDRSDDHRLVIHDWPDHCEDGIHLRLAREGRTFANGQIPKLTRLSKEERGAIERHYKGLSAEPENEEALPSAEKRTEALESALGSAQKHTTMPCRAVPGQAVPLPSRAVAVPCPDVPVRGAASVAAILSAGDGSGGGGRKFKAEDFHRISGDPPEALGDWRELAKTMKEHGGINVLIGAAKYAEDCADPAIRKAKDLGPLKKPGGYMFKQCAEYLRAQGVDPPRFQSRKRAS